MRNESSRAPPESEQDSLGWGTSPSRALSQSLSCSPPDTKSPLAVQQLSQLICFLNVFKEKEMYNIITGSDPK